MSPARVPTVDRSRRRKAAFSVGAVGFVLLLVAVQLLALGSTAAVVAGWTLVTFGVGAVLWAVRELWDSRAP